MRVWKQQLKQEMFELIIVLFALSLLSPWICKKHLPYLGWLLAIVPALIFILLLAQIHSIVNGDTVSTSIPWLPFLDINLSFYLDGLSLIFSMLITGIGALVVLYSYSYLGKHKLIGQYYCYLFLFMGAMLGTVLSNNLITLFVFWELTSISSYLLISFDHNRFAARHAALQGLLVTVAGGLLMLVGFLIINAITGHTTITWLIHNNALLHQSSFYTLMTILILCGALTKSAQFPFHFWLPNAMEAPTPISAYLHSATMVKLGIYLVARMTPILGHTALWSGMLTGFGAATMIVAAVLSLRVTDLKLLLAYSTIMALGTLMFLLASGDAASVEAAMIFLVAHAIYKGALFLCVGGVNHETGTRELSELGGLVKFMPIIFLAVLFSAISMAGLPPVLGFISKEAIYSARLAEPEMDWLLIAIAVITNAVFFTLALIVTIKPFLRRAPYQATAKIITDPGVSLWLPPVLLSLIGFAFGLNPSLIDDTIIAPAVASIMQKNITVELKLWHGVSPALLLSLGTFVMGAIIYFLYMKVRSFLQRSRLIDIISPSTCYEKSLKALQVFAFRVTSFLHNGYLRVYLTIVFLCMSILTFFTFFYFEHIPPTHIMPNAPWFGWLIAIVMVIGAFALVINAPYLASLVFLGVIGLCSTLIFLLFSAPDVAMTQILVDVLTIVIVVLALYRLPSIPPYQKMSVGLGLLNAVVSISVGLTVTLILLSIISTHFHLFVNNYFAAHSYSVAHGKNIVNVILVDFRAFDTLGEITVVAVAGIGVYGLLKAPRKVKVKK